MWVVRFPEAVSHFKVPFSSRPKNMTSRQIYFDLVTFLFDVHASCKEICIATFLQ